MPERKLLLFLSVTVVVLLNVSFVYAVENFADTEIFIDGNEMVGDDEVGNEVLARQSNVAKEINCGEKSGASQTIVVSPNYPQQYDRNLNCEYVLRSPYVCKNEFEIKFLDFSIEASPNCVNDRVIINGDANLCGNVLGIKKYPSQNGLLTIKFITNNLNQERGFRMMVTRLPCVGEVGGGRREKDLDPTVPPSTVDPSTIYLTTNENDVDLTSDTESVTEIETTVSDAVTGPTFIPVAPALDFQPPVNIQPFSTIPWNLNSTLRTQLKSSNQYLPPHQNQPPSNWYLPSYPSPGTGNIGGGYNPSNPNFCNPYNPIYPSYPGYNPQIPTPIPVYPPVYNPSNPQNPNNIPNPTPIPVYPPVYNPLNPQNPNPEYPSVYPPVYNPSYPQTPTNPQYPSVYPPAYNPSYPQTPTNPQYPSVYPPIYPSNSNPFPPIYSPQDGTPIKQVLSPQCCTNQFNQRHFYLVSPNFPSTNLPSRDCSFLIVKNHQNICRFRVNFKFFLVGELQNPLGCIENFVEIEGRRICGCQTGTTYISQEWGLGAKTIRIRTTGGNSRTAHGFIFEVIQEDCTTMQYRHNLSNLSPGDSTYSSRQAHYELLQPQYIPQTATVQTNSSTLATYYYEPVSRTDGGREFLHDGRPREPTSSKFLFGNNVGLNPIGGDRCQFGFMQWAILAAQSLWVSKPICYPQQV